MFNIPFDKFVETFFTLFIPSNIEDFKVLPRNLGISIKNIIIKTRIT